ncbi:MAG: hypothetical protein LBM77_03205 [Spirochaetaceae bacterium]|jgi:hypothetical protein|nr:hypothetical protein [Spirochaetaceae bacterium]
MNKKAFFVCLSLLCLSVLHAQNTKEILLNTYQNKLIHNYGELLEFRGRTSLGFTMPIIGAVGQYTDSKAAYASYRSNRTWTDILAISGGVLLGSGTSLALTGGFITLFTFGYVDMFSDPAFLGWSYGLMGGGLLLGGLSFIPAYNAIQQRELSIYLYNQYVLSDLQVEGFTEYYNTVLFHDDIWGPPLYTGLSSIQKELLSTYPDSKTNLVAYQKALPWTRVCGWLGMALMFAGGLSAAYLPETINERTRDYIMEGMMYSGAGFLGISALINYTSIFPKLRASVHAYNRHKIEEFQSTTR